MTHGLEDDAGTVAWIPYSVAMSSGSGPASFVEISGLADAINHAVPTQKELSGSLRRLRARGLVAVHGRRYALTDDGKAMMEAAQASATTVSRVWKNLTLAIGQPSSAT